MSDRIFTVHLSALSMRELREAVRVLSEIHVQMTSELIHLVYALDGEIEQRLRKEVSS